MRTELDCLRLGSHTTAERFRSRKQWKRRRQIRCLLDSRAYGRVSCGRSIRPLHACLHVRKLESEGVYTGLSNQISYAAMNRFEMPTLPPVRKQVARYPGAPFL